jgi:hypothetical protein
MKMLTIMFICVSLVACKGSKDETPSSDAKVLGTFIAESKDDTVLTVTLKPEGNGTRFINFIESMSSVSGESSAIDFDKEGNLIGGATLGRHFVVLDNSSIGAPLGTHEYSGYEKLLSLTMLSKDRLAYLVEVYPADPNTGRAKPNVIATKSGFLRRATDEETKELNKIFESKSSIQ